MSMISELVEKLRVEAKSMGKYGTDYMATLLTRSADTIEMLSEKAREPKQGEWIKRTKHTLIAQVNFAYCSECGHPIMHEHTRPLWNYCPHCGAKMKG